ncbi:RluA family pseudouridine synthase [Pseudomonadota bacterium]
MEKERKKFRPSEQEVGVRIDKVISARMADISRQYLQKVIKDGYVKVNGKPKKAHYKLKESDTVVVVFPEVKEVGIEAKDIPLDIVYEDDDLLVINKDAGLVVHPGVGDTHADDSLVNAIMHHCGENLSGISGEKRPGIVHRLDKDTSGLIVVAKNDKAHQFLSDQFRDRKVKKVYYALLVGRLEHPKGTIEAPIGRDSRERKKMAVTSEDKGKMGITKYEVLEYLGDYTFVKVYLLTGRTHQIRVHFSEIGFPLVGDTVYGNQKVNNEFQEKYDLKRQFLHSGEIELDLPNGKKSKFEKELPRDLERIKKSLSN